ncbi:AI-2E family transporter [Devosia sediminis]|uniref:AI-2E family transporter n=1 Tax=Devosia sediminis TaxID=2798801 RepID=A0A934MMW0_9HYPH|nr:AI-2E family transporter [Devosia sediminis]MBJ3786615.1 AI-2E family transporter [Devosia sediminis]
MPVEVRAIVTGVFVAAALMLAWFLSHTILIIFAGVLIACVLDAAVRGLRRLVPAPRPLLLVIVSVLILAVALAALSFGGVSLILSVQDLWRMLSKEVMRLYNLAIDSGVLDTFSRAELESMMQNFLPDPGGLVSQAGSFFGSTLGVLSNVVVIIFLGLFFAINPAVYRDGFLLLMPQRHRPLILSALTETGEALRGWMVTQLAMMVLIGTLVGLMLWALGVPNALVLGLLAGSLNFIPFLGPIFSAVPVLLTLAAEDTNVLILGAVGLLLIQNLEGYILTPMLQQRIIKLSPAWSLSIMAAMGALFGITGIALATPVYAVARVLVLKLYVEPREGRAVSLGREQRRLIITPPASTPKA